ncbi:YraN family protein, partial [Nostoc sp. HG1]|nr:YraN family protein [Nostoc sp. HG1]
MANLPPSHYPDIGELGEDLVAQWLQSTGWIILHRRFSSRWGEIDIIAEYHEVTGKEAGEQGRITPPPNSLLAFVEVKTRS